MNHKRLKNNTDSGNRKWPLQPTQGVTWQWAGPGQAGGCSGAHIPLTGTKRRCWRKHPRSSPPSPVIVSRFPQRKGMQSEPATEGRPRRGSPAQKLGKGQPEAREPEQVVDQLTSTPGHQGHWDGSRDTGMKVWPWSLRTHYGLFTSATGFGLINS